MSAPRCFRWLLLAAPLVAILGVGLVYGTRTAASNVSVSKTETSVRALEEFLVADPAMELEQPVDHPIGRAAGAVVVGDRLLLADVLVGEVRAYSRRGELLRVIGRPGDGPGEFRAPSLVFSMPTGNFGVYDMQHDAISVFDSTDTFVRRMNLRVRQIGNAPVVLHGAGLVVPASTEREHEAKPGTRVPRLHLVSDSGVVLRSVGSLPAPRNAEESLMSRTLLARVGRHLVFMQSTDPTVHVTTADGDAPLQASAATQFYRPIAWPEEEIAGADWMRAFQEWHNRQMHATALIPLDEHHFLVAFSDPGGTRGIPMQHLVMMDVKGARHFVTEPSRQMYRPLGGDVVGSVRQDEGGSVTFQTLRLREPLGALVNRPGGGR